MQKEICKECELLQLERIGIHIDSHATVEDAERMGREERCAEHQVKAEQEEMF